MGRRYRHIIRVTPDGDRDREDQAAEMRTPRHFVWRGITYRVAEVLATWHLRDRWWQAGSAEQTQEQTQQREYQPDAAAPPGWEDQAHRADAVLPDVVLWTGEGRASSDRYYYRVRCTSGLVCELYHDAVSGEWVLYRVHD